MRAAFSLPVNDIIKNSSSPVMFVGFGLGGLIALSGKSSSLFLRNGRPGRRSARPPRQLMKSVIRRAFSCLELHTILSVWIHITNNVHHVHYCKLSGMYTKGN